MEELLFSGASVDSRRRLYTPSPFAKQNLLYLQETGTLTAGEPHTSRRSRLSSFLFFIVVSGSGSVTYCGERASLVAGDCFFVDCAQPYSHTSTEDRWTLKWVHFNGVNMPGIYEKFSERCGRPWFHAGQPEVFTRRLDELFALAGSGEYVLDMRIYEKLTALLTEIMAQSWQPGRHRRTDASGTVFRVREYLEEHYTERVDLEGLASRFFVNKYHLTRLFRKEYGISMTTFVLQKRITRAKQLLRFTDRSLEEIGAETGFHEPYYFSRMFKKMEGVSPSEFRKQWVN